MIYCVQTHQGDAPLSYGGEPEAHYPDMPAELRRVWELDLADGPARRYAGPGGWARGDNDIWRPCDVVDGGGLALSWKELLTAGPVTDDPNEVGTPWPPLEDHRLAV